MNDLMELETIKRTEKALLQKSIGSYCRNTYVVVTWSYVGMKRREKFFDNESQAISHFNLVS